MVLLILVRSFGDLPNSIYTNQHLAGFIDKHPLGAFLYELFNKAIVEDYNNLEGDTNEKDCVFNS